MTEMNNQLNERNERNQLNERNETNQLNQLNQYKSHCEKRFSRKERFHQGSTKRLYKSYESMNKWGVAMKL
jgi:hypothetical protein